MERLEVEDDEQRERRIQIQLEKLDKSPSSGAPQARKLLNFDFGNRVAWDAGPPTELLSRVQAFLPQIEASNAILAQQAESNPESVDIEHIDEDKDQYIEMNLGLGVFEDRTKRQGKDKEQHKGHQNADQLSSASSSSETSSSSERDATYDSDSSDPDTDSSSEIITSFEPAPRSIKPLPKRSLASRVRPKIHVLNEAKE